MDLHFTVEEQAFREEVRGFLRTSLPADISRKVRGGKRMQNNDFVRWQKILHAQGWGAVAWPAAFGGTGWNAVQQHIFEDECAEAGAPMQLPFGLKIVAPVLITYGSPAQQQRFLPPIIDGTDWWCQGYCEPGSGSDLASLKMSAVRDGGHYLVNGQKTWNTLGQYADWIFCLVRTSSEGRQQAGISFLLIDMKTPGITVRPIIMMDGEHEIDEVWFEDVKVPVENLVGEENKGWTYAKFLLRHERTGIAGVGRSKREMHKLKDIARTETANGRPLIEDQRFRDRIALPFPEEFGGLDEHGGMAVDTMLVMGILGRGLALEPYVSTVILCGGLLRDAGRADCSRASQWTPPSIVANWRPAAGSTAGN